MSTRRFRRHGSLLAFLAVLLMQMAGWAHACDAGSDAAAKCPAHAAAAACKAHCDASTPGKTGTTSIDAAAVAAPSTTAVSDAPTAPRGAVVHRISTGRPGSPPVYILLQSYRS